MKNITSGNSEIESKEVKEASRIPGKFLQTSKTKQKKGRLVENYSGPQS